MHKFDYSFLENGLLPANLINIVGNIYSLSVLSRDRQQKFADVYTELTAIAQIQSVKYSNEIEGIVTTDERIKEIVNGSTKPFNHNEQEIAGYRDALSEIHRNYDYITFNELSIKRLHSIMLNIAGHEYAGQYKSEDNDIIEKDPLTGLRRIRFHPTSAADTPSEMEQLMLTYMDANDNPNINQLLLIPCVILDFLCIHPFRDGNGRLSRLISLLLLYKNRFDVGKYISFEEQINRRKGNYYDALLRASTGWHENKNDYAPFITEFLLTLYLCYKELDQRFAVVGTKRITKQARIEAVVLNSLMPISKNDITKILPDVSPTTIEKVLGEMMQNGSLQKIGSGRNTKYLKIEL
ncbi:MAG: Fic family protein [Alphaproteobacteria bacterium]|nr:Fic family protein [Alphaproteobacteria bacterium]